MEIRSRSLRVRMLSAERSKFYQLVGIKDLKQLAISQSPPTDWLQTGSLSNIRIRIQLLEHCFFI